MRDYCEESLAKQELKKKMSDEKLTYEMLTEDQKIIYDYTLPDKYYQYKLKGTVVHYGTVDGGHYYSYIKERGTEKWYEFNDTSVKDYDYADLAEDTFGGTYQHMRRTDRSGEYISESERLHNAYVLIYEREEFIDSKKIKELSEEGEKDFNQLLAKCNIPLQQLKIEDDILNELTVIYNKSWIANKMFDDSFIEIILNMCQNSSASLWPINNRSADVAMEVDNIEEELYKLKFTTLFFLGVIIRSESRQRFAENIFPQLLKNASQNLNYSQWIVQ